jgi:hypothetical protein
MIDFTCLPAANRRARHRSLPYRTILCAEHAPHAFANGAALGEPSYRRVRLDFVRA